MTPPRFSFTHCLKCQSIMYSVVSSFEAFEGNVDHQSWLHSFLNNNVCVLDFMVRRRRFLAAAVLMALIALMNLFVCLLKKILADMNRPSVNCRQLWVWAVFVKNRVMPSLPSWKRTWFCQIWLPIRTEARNVRTESDLAKPRWRPGHYSSLYVHIVWVVATKVTLKNNLWNVCMGTICSQKRATFFTRFMEL